MGDHYSLVAAAPNWIALQTLNDLPTPLARGARSKGERWCESFKQLR